MAKRKEGWYWVKDMDGWKCAEWRESTWFVGWSKYSVSDYPFDMVGARIPTPNEPWQSVPKNATQEMYKAAWVEMIEGDALPSVWPAMLAASPTPEEF